MNGKQAQSPIVRVGRYATALAVVWTAVLAASLTFSLIQDKQEATDLARSSARIALEKDILYRRWNAGSGGVYVPVTSTTLPNPYLRVAERDIITSAGRRLTLMNPAYMTRQVHELAAQRSGVLGHITSLKPIRLENAPDPWERQALEAFERGTSEVGAIETINGKPFMRLMRPLATEKACLKCHAAQGYKEGDIRGGISVSIPMATLWAIVRFAPVVLVLCHGALWVVGLGGIALSARGVRRRVAERKRAAEELGDSRKMLENITQGITDGILLLSKDLKIIWANQAILRQTGYKLEGVEGNYCYTVTHRRERPCQPPNDVCPVEEIMKTGKPVRVTHTHVNKEGDKFFAEVTAYPIHNEKGEIVQFVHLSRDITERVRAEQALRDSEARYRALFERSTDGILIADMETKMFRYANPAICRMLGYTEEELRTMGVADIHPKEALQSVMAEFEAQARGDKTLAPSLPCLRKDGTVLYADVNAGAITIDDRVCNVGLFRDMTERKRTEEALRDSEARYRALFERSTDGIVIADIETKIFRYANPAICRMLGYTEEELRTMGVADIHPKEALQSVMAEFEAQARGDKTLAVNLPCLRKDGTVLYADVNAGAITIDDRVCNVGLFRDMTERKRAADALRESEEKFRTLVENLPIGLYRNTPGSQGRFIAVNPAIVRMFGYESVEAFRASSVADLYRNPADRKAFSDRLLAQGRVTQAEIRLKKKDGTLIWGAVTASVVRNAAGEIEYFDGMVENITERKHAADALRDSEARYRALFEGSADGILIADIETKMFRYANPAICRMLGYTEEELRTMGVADIHPKEALQSVMAEFEAQTRGDKTLPLNIPCLRKDGTILHADINTVSITIDDRVCNVGLFRDVTEQEISRRRIEAAAKLVNEISPIGDRTRLLDLVIQRATDLLEADFGVIVELDPVTNAIGAAYSAKFPVSRIPAGTQLQGQGIWGRIAGGEAVWTADISAEPGYVEFPSWHPHVGPCIGLPLRLLGTILGILLLGREKGKPPFTEEDANYARTLAHHAAVGIDRTRRMEALHAMSLVDPLTGLKNRRGFLLLAEQQMKMASRVKRGLWLLFVDLDGLKWINDNLGHAEGDQALVAAADVFKGTFRESDVMARMGGDEFAVLAVETTQTNAEPLEVRLQKNIEAWNDREHRPYALSVSAGTVRYDPESPCSLQELLTQADTLMYEQKREKRKMAIEKLAQDECEE